VLDPEQPNRDVRYRVLIDFADRNGDVLEGEGEILLNKESIGRKRIDRNGGDINATDGTLEGLFWVHAFRPVKLKGTIRIFDRAGHQSNELKFVLRIGEVRQGKHHEVPAGTITGRIESVTVSR